MRTLLFLLVAAALVSAVELPVEPAAISAAAPAATGAVRLDRGPSAVGTGSGPVWLGLERFSPEQRANARIEVLVGGPAPAKALELGREAEALWNEQRFAEALEAFRELGTLVDPQSVELGIAWRVPVPTLAADWGTDVRIGNRDSVQLVAFDVHRASGNLFAVLLYQGDGTAGNWSTNISTDGGETWHETYFWNASYGLRSLSATVFGDFIYIAYGRGLAQNQAFLRRCRASDGAQVYFNTGVAYIYVDSSAAGDSIAEVSLVSNQDYFNNRMYYVQLRTSDSLKYFWTSDTGAVSWNEVSVPVVDAECGLDACTNEGYDSLFLFLSYYDANDTLEILGRRDGVWSRQTANYAGTSYGVSSIAAYQDTVVCAYNYFSAPGAWCRYLASYRGRTGWYWGYFDDTLTTQECPAVTGRGGGGQAALYRFYTDPRELRLVWRNYAGAWSVPVVVGDIDPMWIQPGVEYLGAGNYGVVFVSRSVPFQGAFFDRTDWTGVVERRRMAASENILSVVPNPLAGRGQVRYNLSRASGLVLRVYDQSGRAVRTVYDGTSAGGRNALGLDATGLAPGIYFLRADADGSTLTVPFTVVR
jgi:hypothetical protein